MCWRKMISPSIGPRDQLLDLLPCQDFYLSLGYRQVKSEPTMFVMLSYSWFIPRAYTITSFGLTNAITGLPPSCEHDDSIGQTKRCNGVCSRNQPRAYAITSFGLTNDVRNVALLVVDPSSIHHYIFWADQCYHRVHMMVEVQWYGNSDELLLSPSTTSLSPLWCCWTLS